MNRFLCIHAHFYQPPRENPWIERIEYQGSAYPFHDWNERITEECYAPNAFSRLMDEEGRAVQLVNNYSKINFNFGPTLLTWLEEFDPRTYATILEGDRVSRSRFGGHGCAIAQAYNHMILPLADRRDKETQVRWGLKDFEIRFGRQPESMWLPETAVDLETLEILADHGMKYVILAPRQAKEISAFEEEKWRAVDESSLDTTRPYKIDLPGGKSIAAFFYHGANSRAVAFEGLLHNGETFANRLTAVFQGEKKSGVQLSHIATDGETYGHHHRHGEMALSYALHHIETHNLARLTNYGEFLELHPPVMRARIHENSSWSCAHGVERWRSDCGCNSGMQRGWRQSWRQPLRESLDQLRDRLRDPFEKEAREYTQDPWRARDAYIDLILDRSNESRERFLKEWTRPELSFAQVQRFLKSLEVQRQLMLMYTSCGWFFDELSGIETVQNLKYAYRAIQLAEDLYESRFSEDFETALERAESNILELSHGREVARRYVKPSEVDLLRVGAHFAANALTEEDDATFWPLRVFDFQLEQFQWFRAGRARLAVGKLAIRSNVTLEEMTLMFSSVHLGDHNMSAGVRRFLSQEFFQSVVAELVDAFNQADLPQVIRLMDRHYSGSLYSLKDLFYDEQQRLLRQVMDQAMADVESSFKHLYQGNYPLMRFLNDTDNKTPGVFQHIAEFVQNTGIRHALTERPPNTEDIRHHVQQAERWGSELDSEGLSLAFQDTMERMMEHYERNFEDLEALSNLIEFVRVAQEMPFHVELWTAQNIYFRWRDQLQASLNTDQLKTSFLTLGQELKVRIE